MTNDMMSADCRVQALSRPDIEEDRKQQIIANLQSAADGGQVAAAKALGAAYYYGTGVSFRLPSRKPTVRLLRNETMPRRGTCLACCCNPAAAIEWTPGASGWRDPRLAVIHWPAQPC